MLALFNTLHPSDCIDLYALPLENLLLILFFFHQSNFCLSHLPSLKKVPFFSIISFVAVVFFSFSRGETKFQDLKNNRN